MNTMNNDQPARRMCGAGFWTGLILLFIGLVVGALGSKPYWQRSSTIAMNETATKADSTALTAKPMSSSVMVR
jgi:hypothetical protein